MTQPVQSGRWRFAVFVAVIGLHFLAGLIVLTTGKLRIVRLGSEDFPLSILPLSAEHPSTIHATTAPGSTPTRNPRKREASPEIDRLPSVAEPESNNAITTPYIDLNAEADAAVHRQLDNEESERRRRSLAGPSASQLEWSRNNIPLVREHHLLGDSERAEGGELITWVDDKCFFTTHGISTFGMPQTSKVCKDPPKPDTELFKDMRKKLDERSAGRAP
ncbi:MAG: hypothetical protein M3N91_09900 [Pseudomonadota bacterium]|nr:hypothetical protein [Pseudomonadota bacterium]